ncbi:MAG: hypothetical protein CO140_03730 [Candidatus Moranbacteria bacterium CG_4_9_14_3_um_filter_40_7]|nr:MAG: hypothetical protein COX31_00605 [Candidatus Moranbacteria bacterium CG23_combo_of_CG06-09_8_20_14_all_40_16]PIU80402.1 MAG: hypothetical protein COS71_03885 [Candidatus Moranbacteria bacterium CG06_land_8_20_14_3_00_40_12]PJA87554.1 MAG: hypothetical protein CO140_03730 [Candidatus Moranbacteria bacterium CG_4_9_14_3_um_filter_40_7]
MYIMYIDESGDTVPISQKGKNFLILTGCILHENDKFTIEGGIKKRPSIFFVRSFFDGRDCLAT